MVLALQTRQALQTPVPAALPRLDLATATREQLVSALESVERAMRQGWADRVYRVQVVLREAEGHIYSTSGGRRKNDETGRWEDMPALEKPWSLQGPGWDRLNAAAGVTVVSISQDIGWDGIMPARIDTRRMAVGFTPAGTLRAAPVAISLHARHYRFEQIKKAASYYDSKARERRPTPGFLFTAKPAALSPTQLWLRTETIGDGESAREIGYLLDMAEPRVREYLEDSATFAKNLSRSAETIAGRRASQQWHGFTRLDPATLRLDDAGRVEAVITVTGWRSDLTRQHLEGLAAEVARGADVAEAVRVVGVSRPVESTHPVIDVDPDPTDHEDDELAADGEAGASEDPVENIATSATTPSQSQTPATAPASTGTDLHTGDVAVLRGDLRAITRAVGMERFMVLVGKHGKDIGISAPGDIGKCESVEVLAKLLGRIQAEVRS